MTNQLSSKTPINHVLERERCRIIKQAGLSAVEALPPRTQMAFSLRYLSRFSVAIVAERMKCSKANVKRLSQIGRRRVEKAIVKALTSYNKDGDHDS